MGKLSKIVEVYEKKINNNNKKKDDLSGDKKFSPSKAIEDICAPKEFAFEKIFLDNVAPQILTFHQPESLVAENFKILRSQILHPRTGLPSRFILITSAIPQEGKTYVAINLAFSFAKNVPTLLIESDLRRPTFSSILGVTFSRGLSDFFKDPARDIEEFIYQTNYKGLFLLPAGNVLSDVNDRFSSDIILKFIESLRKKFSNFFFIFDSPPVLVASETISLSRLMDGTVFVVRYGFSDRDVVAEALDKIGRSKVLGLVFNAFMPSSLGLFSPKLKHFKYAYRYKYYKSY